MATNRLSNIRGPGYLTYNTATTPSVGAGSIQFSDDVSIDFEPTNEDLISGIMGKIDETRKNRIVKLKGTPMQYQPSQLSGAILAWLFAQCNALPVIGASLCGSSDTPVLFSTVPTIAGSCDGIALMNACVPKPPELTLDIGKGILGPLEVHGLIRNNFDPETANSFFTNVTGLSYAAPVLLQTSDLLGRQRYYGYWAAGNTACANTDWGAAAPGPGFQGKEGITITFEADWQPYDVEGLTRDYNLGEKGLLAMAKFIPVLCNSTNTVQADIIACQQFQGTGSKHGSRLSGNTGMGDVVFYGQLGGTFTIKNAVLKTAGFKFGGKPLRAGEIGLLGTFNMTASPATGGVLLS